MGIKEMDPINDPDAFVRHSPCKVNLSALVVMHQYRSFIMGGTEPQWGAICICGISIQYVKRGRDGKNPLRVSWWCLELERNASATFSGRLSLCLLAACLARTDLSGELPSDQAFGYRLVVETCFVSHKG